MGLAWVLYLRLPTLLLRPWFTRRRRPTTRRPMLMRHIAMHLRHRPITLHTDRLSRSMHIWRWTLAISSLCVSMSTTACSVEHRPKLQYSGRLTSTVASCPEAHGTLVIQRDAAVFAPDDGTWTLEGKVAGTVVQASRSQPSFDHKTYSTALKATLTATKATGTYVTLNCTYAVDLTKF